MPPFRLPGEARLDQDIVAQIFLRVRDLYKKEGGKFPDPILNLSWAYADASHPSLSQVAMELNGKALADLKDDKTGQVVIKAGQQLPGFAWLKDDGTTMCGNWIYSGMWTEAGCADSAARHGRSLRYGHLSELGVVVAGQPARAVQPRVVRPRRQTVGSDAEAGLVERSERANGPAMTCRTSSRTRIRRITWVRSS